MTEEAKKKEREKRRERYKTVKRGFELQKEETRQNAQSNYIPKSAEKFAERIEKAVKSASPRKKSALLKTGLFASAKKNETNAKIVAQVKRRLKFLKRQRTKQGRSHYQLFTRSLVGKYVVEHELRKALDIKWEHWMRMSEIEKNGQENEKRSDAFSDEAVKNIERFYEYESVHLPLKKTVSGKTLKQKRVLTDTLTQVHKRFLQDHPKLKVSLSHFRKLRPKEVLTVNKTKFASCLCEYCLNIEFKIDVLRRAIKSHDIDHLCTIESKYDAVDISLCEKLRQDEEFHDRKCLERECDACGKQKLKTYLKPLIDAQSDAETPYVWKRWKLGTVGSAAGSCKRQVLAEQSGTLRELIDEFVEGVDFLSNHLFIARWQYKQFNEISKSVPENVVVTIADFAENYRCMNQDEIQSAYYNYNQATVFPMIAYYRCQDCKDSVVQESAVFISPDLTHDALAAEQFSKTMAENIQGHVHVSKEVQFSDGSASQFKSKIPFLHVSETNTHVMERAYFGSRHGKSPCDALGGLIKKKAELYVKSRKGTIQNAHQLFNYCKENLTMNDGSKCEHKKRVFFYHESIKREQLLKEVQTIKGTRKVHSVRGVESGIVKTRHLSCFCHTCLSDEEGNCPNQKYVGEWQTHYLFKGDKRKLPTSKKEVKGKKKQNEKGKKAESQTDQKKVKQSLGKNPLNMSNCTTIKDLQYVAAMKRLDPLPQNVMTRTFCNTAKTVDKNSMTLLPGDIPKGLHPAIIHADGNCLPRSASLLAYGTEDHFEEMRERIVFEMVQNEELYLDNKYMQNGMNPNGNLDVAKTFASYSMLYKGTRLNKKHIREVYEQEALSICKSGTYMGMWQLASLANILSCPVVSVYPEYGSHTVRNDMHRVFYPFDHEHSDNECVYIMWTNINGSDAPENMFTVNHFVVLMQLTSSTTDAIDIDCSIDIDTSFGDIHHSPMDLENDSYDPILDVLNYLDVDLEVPVDTTGQVKGNPSDQTKQPARVQTEQSASNQKASIHTEQSISDQTEQSACHLTEMSASIQTANDQTKQPVTRPSSQPMTRPSSQPVTRPSSQSVTRPSSQQVSRPSSQPVTRPSS